MTWEGQYQAWRAARGVPDDRTKEHRRVLAETRHAMRGGGPLDTEESWRWLDAAPSDRERARFLAIVCMGQQISKRLAYLMVRAGVLERDPSLNGWFVKLAVKTLGAERVCELLLVRLRTGTDAEKAGAASARYWVGGDEAFWRSLVAAAFHEAMLREFVVNRNLDVRRRILPLLPLRGEEWQPGAWPLVEQAIAIARAHSDEYIRYRVEVQLDTGDLYKPTWAARTSLPPSGRATRQPSSER